MKRLYYLISIIVLLSMPAGSVQAQTGAFDSGDDAVLNSLTITGKNGESISFSSSFDSHIFFYKVTVLNSIDSIIIDASPNSESATVTVDGVENWGLQALRLGDNFFDITVTAEDGISKLSYTINVFRPASLKFLSARIGLYELDFYPLFRSSVYEYDVYVPSVFRDAIPKITFVAETDCSDATVKSERDSDNTDCLKVTLPCGESEKIYSINVHYE